MMISETNKNNRQIDTILVVIVLYRININESESYQSIRLGFLPFVGQGKKVDLVVVNNGPEQLNCQIDESIFQLHYIEQLDNPGVSKAYNIAAEIANQQKKSWLLLLDQDTRLPIDFWHHYSASLVQYPGQPLYAPKLLADNVLVSPCGYRYYRGHVLPGIASGIQPMRAHNVLNSGLLVSVEALLKVGGYDESVGLYFSDFVFFDRLKKNYSTFVVIDISLKHDLSSSDYSSVNTALQRFKLYCLGARTASKQDIARFVLYFVTVGARSLVMNGRFKTFSFTRTFFKTWFYAGK